MELFVLLLLAALGLAAYVFQAGRDDVIMHQPHGRLITLGALLPLLLLLALLLLLGLGEMLGGVAGGAFHLVPVPLIGVLAWLAWQRPGAGGVTLIALGVVVGAMFGQMTSGNAGFNLQAALITCGPFGTSGVLLLAAARRRAVLVHR